MNDTVDTSVAEAEKYGKFDSAEALLRAYNALEGEFTKRCQLIKELQTELASLKNAQEKPNEDGERADRSSAERALTVSDIVDFLAANAECVDILAELPSIENACIARYKQRLIGVGAICSPQGVAVIAPVKRPRSLEEAKCLADEILMR